VFTVDNRNEGMLGLVKRTKQEGRKDADHGSYRWLDDIKIDARAKLGAITERQSRIAKLKPTNKDKRIIVVIHILTIKELKSVARITMILAS